MHLIKRIIFYIYYKILSVYNRLKYFYFPNLLNRTKYTSTGRVHYNQRFIYSGLGKISVGSNCTFGYEPGGFHFGGSVELQARSADAHIEIGNDVSTNNNIFICSANNVRIGARTLIGQNVCIMDFEAHGIPANERNVLGQIGTVDIGINVWIGNNVTILKNSVIGENSIVATGAVVAGKFPANVIIGGIPAKIIRNL